MVVGESWLKALGGLLMILIAGSAAMAEECGYATRNYYLYLDQCQLGDGCQSRGRAEQLVLNACGGVIPSRNALSNANDAMHQQPQENEAGAPQASPNDCRYLVARLKEMQASRIDPDTLTLRKAMAERACGGPVDLATEPTPEDACKAQRMQREEVLAAWERKVRNKEAALQEGLRELLKLKQELQNDARWIGPWRELAVYIIKPLDTAGTLFENVLALFPQTGELVRVAGVPKSFMVRIIERLQDGLTIYDIVNKDLEEIWIDLLLEYASERTTVGAATKTIYDLTQDIIELKVMPEQFIATRGEIARQISNIDVQVKQMLVRMQNNNKIRERIHAYALEVEAAYRQICPTRQPGPNLVTRP